jgi:hypothetical protein
MARTPIVGCDQIRECVAKTFQVVLTAKIAKDLHTGCVPDPVKPVRREMDLELEQRLKETNYPDEILEISGFVEKASFSGNY